MMEEKQAFKFCPRCGKSFQTEDNHLQCSNCGLSYYINPKPCANVILVNARGEYLLSRRAFEPAKGLWDVPGGFVEPNETLEEAASRELKEELGIDFPVDKLRYLKSSPQTYLFQTINYELVTVFFIARLSDDTVLSASDDVAELKFFAADSLPTDNFSYPGLDKDIAAAAKFLQQNEL